MARIEFMSKKRKREYLGLVWLIPAAVLIAVFSIYPPVAALGYSFTDWDGANASFIGFVNFIKLFNDPVFYKSFYNMLILMVVCMLLGNIMTIILAELLFNLKSKRLKGFFRFAFVIPALIPNIVILMLWGKVILSGGNNSLANIILGWFGIPSKGWLYSEDTVLLSIIIYGFPWVGGTSFLIYLAGLNNIPESALEAGEIDGITLFKRIIYIDLPLIKAQLKYFLILGVIGGVQNYSLQYALTNGGPGMNNASMVPGYYMYMEALHYSRYGYACAIGFVMFIIILAVTIINNRLLKSGGDYL